MKTLKPICLIAGLIALLLPALSAQAAVSIDATQSFQSIRGFGASSAWRSSLTSAQADLFFRTDTGIGLSMLRHRINPSNNFGDGASVLQQARDRGVTQIWATEWSPPAAYKSNNNLNNGGTLLTSHYQDYANYLASYVKTLKSSYNVDLFALSPFNEPDYTTSYESSSVNGSQFLSFVRDYLGPTFASQGLTTRIVIPEPSRNNLLASLADPSLNDANAAKYLFAIGTHLYGAGPTAYPLAAAKGKEYWETEMSDFNPNDPGMGSGLQLAGWIHNSLAVANMNAFHFWWLINVNTDNEGLLDSSGNVTKRLYVMGNYSKFIRPGATRIGAPASPANNVDVSAYRNANNGSLVIVAVNRNGSASSQTFNLNGVSAASVIPWVTDGSRNLAQQSAAALSGNSFSYSLPAQSVTSFVVSLSSGPSPTPVPPSATPTRTRTQTPVTPVPTATVVTSTTWRINAGGAAYTDGSGHAWSADADFSGGTARQISNAISGTADQALYQSERYGDSSYSFAVPAGSYRVTLKMAETYDGITAAGQRVFNASINGATVINNLDLFAQAGLYGAVDRVFDGVSPLNGQIVVQVGPASANNATVSAIEVIPQPATPTFTVIPATPTRSSTSTSTFTSTATWTSTPTWTATRTSTPTSTATNSATVTSTGTFTRTWTASVTASPTATPTATWTLSPVLTATAVTASTWRVVAGGTAYTDSLGHNWSADSNFSGGTARQITNAISGTPDQTLYQSERYGDSSYTFAVNPGSYQLTLKFAETYNGITAAGMRVFNVSVNGSTVLNNLDLFAQAGLYGAVDRVIDNVSPVNGQIVIQVGPASANNATIGAIQIIPQPAPPTATAVPPSPTPTLTLTAIPGSVWRVVSGGTAYTDSLGQSWSADSNFSGGTARQITNAISGTADQTLYQSERYGDSTYSFAVNPGSYQLTLKFAETYNGITAAGMRVFNVSVNGSPVLSNLDLFAQAGLYGAVDRVIDNVSPVNGQIVIQLGPASANNATIGAIQIIPQPSAGQLSASRVIGKETPVTQSGPRLLLAPNPAKNWALVQYQLPAPGRATLDVASLDGRGVLHQDLGLQSTDRQSLGLDLSSLASGIYLVVLRSDQGEGFANRATFKLAVKR